jgi:hypothetical protein
MTQRTVTIIGGGQSGLHLALGLQSHGYDVRIIQNRTADDVRTGRVMSSQCMFGNAVALERDLGLAFWEEESPDLDSINFSVPLPDGSGGKAINWNGMLDRKAQAVDQRVKIPGWMAEFERRGGRIEIREAGIAELEAAAATSDLVIVAAGKGDVTRLFARDEQRSVYAKPQRAMALTYVTGMTPRPEFTAIDFNLVPGVGEYVVFPSLTTTGPCEIMVFEGQFGGPWDCWGDVRSPEEHLAKSKWILDTFLPWQGERCRNVELTDPNGVLAGTFTPTVRHPVGKLPSGKLVLGMADAVVLNDPVTGQGSNNAAKCASMYLDAILQRGAGAFDAAWMQATFDAYWDYAQYVTNWTNALLQPPPPHVLKLMGSAQAYPALAKRIANAFDYPPDFFPWFAVESEAEAYLQQLAA